MDVGTTPGPAPLPVDDDLPARICCDPDEGGLGIDGATPDTRALRDPRQDDTSDNQLIARWRNRARSPMSMPVVAATCSIGVLIRSSGE